MGDLRVTYADLLHAARSFRAQAEECAAAMPPGGLAAPDGGDWVINGALSAALETLGLLNARLASGIEGDGGYLNAKYQEFREAEETITPVGHAVVVTPAEIRKAEGGKASKR